jgi:hypothetical protein
LYALHYSIATTAAEDNGGQEIAEIDRTDISDRFVVVTAGSPQK